ncbi:MAG: hypothetical protein PWQ65_15 [Bacteroidota bacterium]|nr:hypothetical protein [Bacteroidota bacterium]
MCYGINIGLYRMETAHRRLLKFVRFGVEVVESLNILFINIYVEKFLFWNLCKVNKSEVRRKYDHSIIRTMMNSEGNFKLRMTSY